MQQQQQQHGNGNKVLRRQEKRREEKRREEKRREENAQGKKMRMGKETVRRTSRSVLH